MYYLSIVEQDKIIKFWAFENLAVAEKVYSEVKNLENNTSLYTYDIEDVVNSQQKYLSSYHIYLWNPIIGGSFKIANSYKEMKQIIRFSYYAVVFRGKNALHSRM